VDADEYARELSRYIHLNPVRAGIENDPFEYKWSSCRYYTTRVKAPEWLQRKFILAYFGNKPAAAVKRYRDYVEAIITKKYESPLKERLHAVILGSQDFIDRIKTCHLKNRPSDRELPDLNETRKIIGLDKIETAVDRVIASNEKLARQLKLYFCHRYTGLKLKEIGRRYGISESGLTLASRRVRIKSENDNKLSRIIQKIGKMIKV